MFAARDARRPRVLRPLKSRDTFRFAVRRVAAISGGLVTPRARRIPIPVRGAEMLHRTGVQERVSR